MLKSYTDEVIRVRRDLHKIPEPGFQEIKTQKYIIQYLAQLGLKTETCAETGVLCLIDFGKDTAIALRSDMDGLPVHEKTEASYHSEHEGMMHACGHDGHMTMLLVLAKVIVEQNLTFPHNLLLIFQPAEEGPGGAKEIIASGALNKYRVISAFGYHLSPDYPFGVVASRGGEFFASGIEFYIKIKGKSSHGAQPHLGKDCVMIGAQLVQALYTVSSRDINPLEDCVVSVGTFHAGDQINVTCGEAKITGIVRSYNTPTKQTILSRMQEICDGYANAFQCIIDLTIKEMYPPLCNDEALFARLSNLLQDQIIEASKVMLAEDFSYYTLEVPSVFSFLGTATETQSIYPLHSSQFDFNEEVLLIGIAHYLTILNHI